MQPNEHLMDIAIVGMSCRFPGAGNYEQYWQNLLAGRNCIGEVPSDRWNWQGTNARWGGFIEDLDKFDPLFFGIAPSEAAYMDPQHRLFLEAAWHAVEDAGYSVASLSGKAIGVYAGVSKNDYAEAMRERRHEIAPYISTGTVHSILANRVSFLLNLRGRSEAIDTACSSSLVALHNAIRDIASGECEAALVGGVNALITPTMFLSHTKSGMLSPDGQCKTFSADANGYVRSEGVGVLFIKPLQKALGDGDHIHAVVRSTAINHGGRSNFLTAPSAEAQAAVVAKALRRASLDPRTIDYVEAHGTGTPLGDPIEINGLKKAFAQVAREQEIEGATAHCALSSAKTNVGHLESASGMAGMIKVILAMKHGRIPAIRNFTKLNPYIELENSPFYIATENVAWETKDHPRRAGISSFGMGGVNAHVVLEEPPAVAPEPAIDGVAYVLPLSAKKGRLAAYAQSLLAFLKNADGLVLRDVAFTLQNRNAFEERAAFVAATVDELIDALERFVATGVSPAEWNGDVVAGRRMPLPVYPFARKRCWFSDAAAPAPVAVAAADHGTTTLKTSDFFIRDHVVQGKPMLPGVMHLELARAAGSARALRDVYWIAPVVVERDVTIDVRLNGTSFELRQNDIVHSKGTLVTGASAATHAAVDFASLRARCHGTRNQSELYELFRKHGLAYGGTFQVLESCVFNDRELVAELRLPEEAHGALATYALHPSVMDGVFQAVTALSVLGGHHPGQQFIPFHLQSAELVQPLTGRCRVYAKLNEGHGKWPSFDAVLAGEAGNVLVKFDNLQKRPLAAKAEEPLPRDVYYRPEWRKKVLPPRGASAAKPLVLFAKDGALVASFAKFWNGPVAVVLPGDEAKLQELKPSHAVYLHEDGAHGVFAATQAAFRARLHELKLVYVQTSDDPAHATAGGFARTLKYENPKYDYVTVAVDDASGDAIARAACAELFAEATALRETAYRGGERFERQMVRETAGDETLALTKGGVYVVSGGAGGLGSIFSRLLAEKHGAKIVWLGRSPKNAAIERKAEEIGATYFSVDITDAAAVNDVIAQVKAAHGAIHGVIHAAGFIEDAFILRKQPDSFARVLAPKVAGTMNLDAATRNEPLDFFVVFSSIAALMPNQGQCDYAAGNSFLDAFVEARGRDRERSGVSLSINWPLWAGGGIRVSAEEERHLLRVFGMKPLPTAHGIEIFEAALAMAKSRNVHQIAAIDGDREKIERCLGMTAPATAPATTLDGEIKSIFAAHLGVSAAAIDGGRTIGELGIDSTAVMGVIRDLNQRFGADLKPTLLFDVNTVDKLAAHLTESGKDKVAVAPWNRSLIDVEQSDPARLLFSRTFRVEEFYLRDHVVEGQYNMPGACYVEMARQAGDLLLGDRAVTRLTNNYWVSQLSSPDADFSAHVQLAAKDGHYAYEIFSIADNGERRLHAMGQLVQGANPAETKIDLAAVQSRCDEVQQPEKVYAQIVAEGLHVARSFCPMTKIFLSDGEALGMLSLPEEIRATDGDYVLHPALLTGVFQTALISNRRVADNDRRYIPIGMDELEVLAPIPADCCIYARPRPNSARNEEIRKFDLEICRTDGVVVGRLKGFSIRALKSGGQAILPVREQQEKDRQDCLSSTSAVEEFIKTKLAGPIGLPAAEIDSSVQFDQYGVTSVMVVELNSIFEELLGPISKTLFFEYRNVAELAEYFVEHHGKALAGLVRPAAAPVAAVTEDGVRAYLRSLIAAPIGLPEEEIDFQTGFDLYGVNSVMVVEMNEIFERIFGPLSKTLFFEYRNIDELAQYFVENHRDKLPAPPAEAAAPRVEIVRANASEGDIAIVSAAGRFPGARDLAEFWDVLREGRDCVTEIPRDRFDYRRLYDADPEKNRIYGKWGGFIDGVDRFDPMFFNISPREAELIDPQERLLLEVVWEMLERAGYTRQRLVSLSDRRVGVFVGALWQPYESVGIEATAAGNVVGPSSLLYSIANRVSYYLDLAGPSMAIDTACSSSLTALHVACQSIRSGETKFAIVGGVNLSLTSSKYLFLSQNRFLATDGRCRSYGAGGTGYVPGEGVGALLLKPLANAIEDHDTVLAVIKGSAINHGGRTNGYTVPSPKAQGNVIAQALEQSGVDPNAISYIDGHGTGTSLGDPIEIEGLGKALRTRDANRRIAIGSVKSNIGHLEAAAGIASVMKVMLQMEHGQLAPSLHSDELNPNINFDGSLFAVQRELAPWTRPENGTRVAGVSSFGAGGSNAHVILEEYAAPQAPLAQGSGPALFVFSARSADRLQEMVRRFEAYLRDANPADLHAIAYTLQLGREAMRERLAIVAGSLDELRAALRNGTGSRGRAPKHPQRMTGIAGRSLAQLAEAWAQGQEIDWSELHGGRSYRCLALPVYPFAQERCWIDIPAAAPAAVTASVLHPVLHRNTSDVNGLRFSTTLTGEEFFLVDHLVRMDGRTFEKVLPGVVCLEMARAAVVRAVPERAEGALLELQNIVWAQPIVVTDGKELDISITANGEHYDFRVTSGSVLHCQGRALWSRPAPAVTRDLGQLAREMQREVAGQSVYEAFVRTGGIYGPTFQGITRIEQGRGQLLAHLRLPETILHTAADFVLHPSLMDSALQGYLGLVDDWFEISGQTRMPFALESLRVFAPCTTEMVAWMRYAPGSRPTDEVVKLDVDLCDAEGRVSVRMTGFAVRAVNANVGRASARPSGSVVTLAPVWHAVTPQFETPANGRTVVVGGDEAQLRALRQVRPGAEGVDLANLKSIDHIVWILPPAGDDFIAAQEEGVLRGFRLIKALLANGYGTSALSWTIVTNGTQRVRRGDAIHPAHASVAGLIGSMAKEYRNWKVRLVDVAGEACPWNDVLRLRADERGDGWAVRDGQWFRRRLAQCEVAPRENEHVYKRDGVYVVIGGAGGVGEVLTEYLISIYGAKVVWIGRRAHDATIEAKLERIAAAAGARPHYLSADARDRAAMERARDEVRARFGRIDGVIHSAIVLSDKSLANMEEEQFRAALSTKVDTAVRLAEVFGREPLDFIVYFSSLMSFLKAPGQSNYAAGCTFTDAFAEWQSAAAGYPVKVMNWGYWGGVGIVAAAEYQERMARMGWGSIEAEEGMAGLDRLLEGSLDQLGMLRVTNAEALRTLDVETGERVWTTRDEGRALCASIPAVADDEAARELANWEEQRRDFDALLAKMLRAELGAAPRVTPEYGRWLEESERILGIYADSSPSDAWAEWDRQKSRWTACGMGPQATLAETTLRSLAAIVRGDARATDVIFPGSSLALVENVYKNNAVADYFNRVMAETVRWYAQESGTQLRLIELGAGTGGSTQGILRKLDACDVREYCYTDISKFFLMHGEKTYGPGRDYLKYAVVNVENGLAGQGVERGVYDAVLAANVLHATKNLRQTLRNAKSALKANGILVLNEITDHSVFMHLTFGLLAGWWAYEDAQLRMGGSPGLTPEAWTRVLEEEGFRNVRFPAGEARELGQQIVVAESDGVIRETQVAVAAPKKKVAELVVTAPEAAVETSHDDLAEKVEAWLVQAVGVLLKVRREDVDPDAELSEFGFDSISLTGFANHANQHFGLELMPTVFFEHPTVRRFAAHLVEKHRDRLAEKLGAQVEDRQSCLSGQAGLPVLHHPQLVEKIEAWLVEAVGVLLKVRREDVDLDAELSEFGFDSISLTSLANHINRAFALELMPTLFFEHPTVRRLARHFADTRAAQFGATLGVVESTSRPVVEEKVVARSLAASKTRRLEDSSDPIAVIGMSGRFPGANDLDAFWSNLAAGRDSIREVPRERWDWRAAAGDGRQGGAQWGAFIDGVDRFDSLFFGISPREAERIDPQHRLAMTYGWKAFEDAGYAPKQLWGSRTGVFIGTTSTGYSELLMNSGLEIEGYTATGIVPSVGPNRISYLLNLRGPSEPIETACSSSLVAVHRAVRSIESGECEMALVGGVNTLFPTLHTSFNRAGMLSPDGKCKTFSSRADGYARGEGVGMIVLKRLSAAERDGDHIYGLIRGSAENHGGRAQTLTAPNPVAQAELIQDALRRAGVSPRSMSYIEAHGTGTPLGDPIEINGLKSAFQSLAAELGEQAEAGYCGLGSVKTNIGHLELAAGIAGLIKILLQMKHETLVPSLHCEEINPYIKLDETPFYVVRENRPWTRLKNGAGEWPRRAGVSSFGFGGVNAHVVVEEYTAASASANALRGPALVVLSARGAEQLQEQARQLRESIANGGDLASIAYTLQVGREAMDYRLAMTARTIEELDAKLAAFLDGRTAEELFAGEVNRNSETLVLFRGDEELREAVTKWVQRGKWAKLLELWVRGLEIDWEQLYGDDKPRRVSLPTYPFANVRCWVDAEAAPIAARAAAPRPQTQTQSQRITLTGAEFFLTDHRVQGRKVLPGVAYLEMVRAAVEREREGMSIELQNTVWAQPVVVDEAREIEITLTDDEFTVTSADGVHAQGRAVVSREPAPSRVDLAALEARMTGATVDAEHVYAACARIGLAYGPSFRSVTAIRQGKGELLARLALPRGVESNGYVLHPSVMDGALQASLMLFDGAAQQRLPFSLASLRVFAPCTREMAAWVRYAPGSDAGDAIVKLDIDLCDAEGRVCVSMRGFASRVPQRAEGGLTTYVPVWESVRPQLEEARTSGRMVIIGGDEAQLRALRGVRPDAEVADLEKLQDVEQLVWILPAGGDDFIAAQEEGAIFGFRLIKQLLAEGYGSRPLAWTVVTRRGSVAHASVHGLIGSMAKEQPQWSVRLVDDAGAQLPWSDVLRLPADERGDAWLWRDGQWQRRRMVERAMSASETAAFRQNGVYVVVGGAGGVGEAISESLMASYAARVVWIGRRQPDAEIEAKLARIESQCGQRPLYLAADARNREEMERALAEIKSRYGSVNGVIHSAIVLADKSLANMPEEQFRVGLSTKVDVSVRIAEVFGGEPLDFILYFSSIQSFVKAAGQSNYAAGCTFMDAFAEWQSSSSGIAAKVMNWGYWGGVGVVTSDYYRQRMAEMGMASLEPSEGMAALEQLLVSDVPQVVFVRTTTPKFVEHLHGRERVPSAKRVAVKKRVAEKPATMSAQMIERHVRALIRESIAEALKMEEAGIRDDRSFSEYGIDSITGVNLVNRISRQCGVTLPVTVIFDHNNVEQLTRFLAGEHRDAVVAMLQPESVAEVVAESGSETGGPKPALRFAAPRPSGGEGRYQRILLERPGSIADVQWTEAEAQPLADNEVRIAVRAFSLNFGDLLCVKGLYPNMPPFPFTPGVEVSGTVVAIGSNVTRVEVGADVIALTFDMGGLATQLACPEERVFRKPATLAFEEACSLPAVGITMIDAFRKARLQRGERILIQTASGGTGLIAVQLAQAAGAEIYATAGSPHKLEYLQRLGVQHVINYREHDFESEIARLTDGEGVDVVINTLSGDAIQKGLNCLAPGGRYIEIAMTALKSARTIDLSVLNDNQTFYSVDVPRLSRKNPRLLAEYFGELLDLVERGVVRPTLGETLALPAIQEAFRRLEDRGNIGKVVVSIPEAYRYRETAAPAVTVSGNSREPIAIVGMSGRFGRTNSTAELWASLSRGEDLTEEVARWPLTPEEAAFCPRGSFLDGIDRFDPLFFKISGVEATYMDPQQRIFLEESWKALEDAGYAGAALQGRQCGVYVGCYDGDYSELFRGSVPPQAFWGNSGSIIPARIAYYLDLQGAAVAVDTACSSSLVAIHLACQALRAGEVEVSIAGGVFLQSTPYFHTASGGAGMLSPTGRCHTFDERADGFVPGEGVGVVVLKRLRDAIADGDHIHGIVRGSGINQDGTTNGITAPSAVSQERLERHVYESFGIHPEEIQMVEAHGTGTKLGDPVELRALTRSFRKDTEKKNYCAIGSIKTNVGHTAFAAGVAGVIKVLLSMQHRQIPPSRNFEKSNPHIDFDNSPFFVNTTLRDWTVDGEARRCAAVSSFGFSGTNSHIVIEEAPARERVRRERPGHLVALSGRTAEQLRRQAEQLAAHLENNDTDLGDISFTLLLGRKHWNHRLTCIARNRGELLAILKRWLEKGSAPQVSVFHLPDEEVNEQESLKRYGTQCIEECRRTNDAAVYLEQLAAVGELFGQGYGLPLERLFTAGEYRRVPLPTYPFARERYWVPAAEERVARAAAAATQIHPLLHENTSDFIEQSYRSEFSGNEFFLRDHVVRGQKLLPGVACLEMVRAAVEQATTSQSAFALHGTTWSQPVIVDRHKRVTVALFSNDDEVAFEMRSHDGEQELVHCQGRAVRGDEAAPERIDLDSLARRMRRGTLRPDAVYAASARMGLVYGPALQSVTRIEQGDGQCLAHLRLPAAAEGRMEDYVLHPSLMDGALQSCVSLLAELSADEAWVPYALDTLRVVSPCTPEMAVWIRHADGSQPDAVKLDLDLCDAQGNVRVQMHGLAVRTLSAPGDEFDAAFYEKLIEGIVNREVSVDDAVELG